MLTPHKQVRRRLVDAPGVTGHAGVGAGVGQVGGANEQAAGLQQGEPGQLDGAAGQDAFACTQGRAGPTGEQGCYASFYPDVPAIFSSDNVAPKQTDYGYHESTVHIYNIVTPGKSRRMRDTKT